MDLFDIVILTKDYPQEGLAAGDHVVLLDRFEDDQNGVTFTVEPVDKKLPQVFAIVREEDLKAADGDSQSL